MFCDLDNQPTCYAAVDRVARKQHVCCECDCPIAVGERYVHCSGRWDNGFNVYRQHQECCEACMIVRDRNGECLGFGALLDYYEECYWSPQGKREDRRFRNLIAVILKRMRHHKTTRKPRRPR